MISRLCNCIQQVVAQMFQRMWAFVKRHRKKFIFSGVLFGGGYVAWRVLLPRLMRHLMERALKSVEEEGGLEKLLGLAGEGDEASRKEAEELKKRQDFEHKQQVSDKHVRKSLDAVNARHMPSFSVDECTAKLKEAKTKEEKLKCLEAIQAECLARTASAVYTLEILLLLHRVEFNIVGREIAAASSAGKKFVADGCAVSDEDAEAQAEFLASTHYVQEEGLKQLASSVRSAVKACIEEAGLGPSTPVTADSLQRFFNDVFQKSNSELLTRGKGEHVQAIAAATLLPDSLEAQVKQQEKVKPLLNEARDYLDSPQFMDVFQAVSSGAAEHLAASMGDGAADPASALLAGGKSCPMAKLFGPLIQNSQATLSCDDRGGFVARFAKDEKVRRLCEALYFQDAKS